MTNKKIPKIVTGNQSLVKSLNSNIVLNLIRTKAPISGADLAKITGMRPATIQNILGDLEREGYVENIGTGRSTSSGGRRPVLWNIHKEKGYVIGIQLEINDIRTTLVNMTAEIVDEEYTSTKKYDTLADIEKIVVDVIGRLLDRNHITMKKLLGVGIGVSGIVDINRGVVMETSLLAGPEQPVYLEQAIRKHLDVPVYVENDANAAALAEKWMGKGVGVENLVFVLVMVNKDVFGIGFGLIIKNELYRGANMFAGETNSFDLNIEKILRDYCHFREDFFSVNGKAVEIGNLELQHLIKALADGSKVAGQFFHHLGKLIGREVVSIVDMLDPEMVVIGGEFFDMEDEIMPLIRNAVENDCLMMPHRDLKLTFSSLNGHFVSLGAAAVILHKIFKTKEIAL